MNESILVKALEAIRDKKSEIKWKASNYRMLLNDINSIATNALSLYSQSKEGEESIECSLDAQQCQQECEHKTNRMDCPFASAIPFKKEFEEYLNKYYPISKENEGKQAGVWVKASERLPEYMKCVNGKLNGRPALVKNSNLTKGYITANGNLERIEDVEWLDESEIAGEKEIEALTGTLDVYKQVIQEQEQEIERLKRLIEKLYRNQFKSLGKATMDARLNNYKKLNKL